MKTLAIMLVALSCAHAQESIAQVGGDVRHLTYAETKPAAMASVSETPARVFGLYTALTAMLVAKAADVVTSVQCAHRGCAEANVFLRDAHGRYSEGKGIALSALTVAPLVTAQIIYTHMAPHGRLIRGFTIVDTVGAGILGWTAYHNSKIVVK